MVMSFNLNGPQGDQGNEYYAAPRLVQESAQRKRWLLALLFPLSLCVSFLWPHVPSETHRLLQTGERGALLKEQICSLGS